MQLCKEAYALQIMQASLLRHLHPTTCTQVRRNSCEALASLALVLPGRVAIAEADGMASLTGALLTAPEAAARALRVES